MTKRLLTHIANVLIAALFVLTCLTAKAAHVPTFNWAFKVGTPGSDIGNSVTTDAAGNVYVTGNFDGTADFDPGTGVSNLSVSGGYGAFVAKYSPARKLIWARSVSGNSVIGQDIAVDTSGNVYVTGRFLGTVDFDPGTTTVNITSFGVGDAYVLKLNAAGNFVWVRRMGGAADDIGRGIAVSGNFVYTTGQFRGTADFDPGAAVFNLSATGFNGDMYVSKLDTATGGFTWAQRFGGPSFAHGSSIAVDSSSGVYVAGMYGGAIAMGSFTLTGNGSSDGVVAKLNSAGTVVFAGKLGGMSSDSALGIAVNASGEMIVVGEFHGTVDFNPGSGTFNLTATGTNAAAFVVKLNPTGNFIWARMLGGPGGAFATDVAVDAFGYIYTTGGFYGTIDFNPEYAIFNLTTLGFTVNTFVSRLSPGGAYDWAGQFGGGVAETYGHSIAVRQFCNGPTQVDVIGRFKYGPDFDPTAGMQYLISVGDLDMFTVQVTFPPLTRPNLYVSSQRKVLKYNGVTGAFINTFISAPGNGLVQPVGLAFGPDCRLYVTSSYSEQVLRYTKANTGGPFPSAGNTGAVFVPAQSGGLGSPIGLTFGEDSRLYVSSFGAAGDVLRYFGVTGAFDMNFTINPPPLNPRGLTFGGPVGDLYVTSDHDILRYNRTTGAPVGSGIFATDAGALTHHDLTFGPDGDLYVTAFQTNKVLRFNGTTGAPLPDFVPAGLGGLSGPVGLTFGPDGNLYVSSYGTNQVLRYNGTTGAFMGVFASGGSLTDPTYLVFGH